MSQFTITTNTEQAFFQRGRRLAHAVDGGEKLTAERILRFEGPAEMMELISAARLALFRAARQAPGSITDMPHGCSATAALSSVTWMRWSVLAWSPSWRPPFPAMAALRQVRASATRLTLMAEVG